MMKLINAALALSLTSGSLLLLSTFALSASDVARALGF